MSTWRKSSYSGSSGNDCVEVAEWRKSSYSGSSGNACVEVADGSGGVQVRDTTNRGGTVLTVSAAAWQRFLARI